MAEIYVSSSSALQGVIDNLTQDNAKYLEMVERLVAEAKNLASKWEGEASTAFQDKFNAEQAKYQAFYEGIQQYITALQEILAKYEAAESSNTNIAAN